MNPGGLRADMVGTGTDYPKTLTYKQAAEVQPFANTLVNMQLTGAQIKSALEQQWQPAGSSRPFLRLGTSKGFTFTYDPAAAVGSRITGIWLDGVAIDPATSYSVTVNSFLASGGDNFGAFNQGTQKKDTGKTDLQGMVDYMAEFAKTTPLAVDYKQHAVGVSFPTGAPASYLPGDEVSFKLSSLAYSTAADTKDAQVKVTFDGTDLGTFPVDNTIGTAIFDEYGTADVTVTLPAGAPAGKAALTVTGLTTGTTVSVPVTIAKPNGGDPVDTSVSATAEPMTYGTDGTVNVTLTPADATGTVTVLDGETVLGSAALSGGNAAVSIPGTSLAPGSHTLNVRYAGDATHNPSSGTVSLTVEKAPASVAATAEPMTYGTDGKVTVTVTPADATGTVTVLDGTKTLGSATLSGGSAVVSIPGTSLTPGTYDLTVEYGGDATHKPASGNLSLTVEKLSSSTAAEVVPAKVVVKRTRSTVFATVEVDGKPASGGTVDVFDGAKKLGEGTVTDGQARIQLPAFDTTGTKTLSVRYRGTGTAAASATTVQLTVVKAGPRMDVDKPGKVLAKRTRPRLAVALAAAGQTVRGKVAIVRHGHVVARGTLRNGNVVFRLPAFKTTGRRCSRCATSAATSPRRSARG